MFDQAGRVAPSERRQREDVAEAVAEHQYLGGSRRPPRLAVGVEDAMDRHRLGPIQAMALWQVEHDGDVAHVRDLARFDLVPLAWRVAKQKLGLNEAPEQLRGPLHRLRSPM